MEKETTAPSAYWTPEQLPPGSRCFSYKVEQVQGGPDAWQASTPYRQVYWCGATEQEAVGSMLRGMVELGRAGSLDPDEPHRMGVPPLQHAMSIMTDRLSWLLERRREKVEMSLEGATPSPTGGRKNDGLPLLFDDPGLAAGFARDNELISGLATAIAALARVKEL